MLVGWLVCAGLCGATMGVWWLSCAQPPQPSELAEDEPQHRRG
jgi:hypothetical protein